MLGTTPEMIEATIGPVQPVFEVSSEPFVVYDSNIIRVVGDRRTYETDGPRLYMQVDLPSMKIGNIAVPAYRDLL